MRVTRAARPEATAGRHIRASRRSPAAGFTLLEMIVATALCTILLAGLWTLYSTYAELFDRGQDRVERSQLSRALMQQIVDDLQSAIQDPIGGRDDEPGGEAQRRRFGLSGTATELRVDVLQVTPLQGNPLAVGTASLPGREPVVARVPELRTISYTFQAANPEVLDEGFAALEEPSETPEAAPLIAGLVRRELDFETPMPAASDTADAMAEWSELPSAGGFPSPELAGAGEAGGPDAADDTLTIVPEVTAIGFRYFDGSGWSSSWNSLQRKALPAAVEVTLTIADPRGQRAADSDAATDEMDLDQAGADQADAMAEMDEFGGLDSSPTAAAAPQATLRTIVELPGSPLYRPAKVESQPETAAAPAGERVAPRRIAPRRIAPPRTTRPAAPRTLPEDWIRTGGR